MPCIAVFNQKGGVGKTTTALNLAAAINRDGNSPLLIDLDPQAHLTALSGVGTVDSTSSIYAFYQSHRPLLELLHHPPQNWRVLAAHLELAKVDTQFGKGPDILNRLRNALVRERFLAPDRSIVIDCSPMLGVLSLSAIFASDRVLIPVSADYLAIKGAIQVERALDALSRVIRHTVMRRYVLTRFDSRRRMSWDIEKTLRERFGEQLCTTRIGETVALAESPSEGKHIFDYAPASRGAQDYQALYAELKDTGFLATDKPATDAQASAFIAKLKGQMATTR
jgi:chromosome partitioning protein